MRLRITTMMLVAMGLFPSGSWAQAAAEYGLAAGKSATATTGAASALNKANRRLTDAIGQRTASATAPATRSQARALKSVPGAASQQARAATQMDGANSGTIKPASSALVIETGKETITLGERGTMPSKAGSTATSDKSTPTRPVAQKRYDSVISLPAKQ